MARTRRTLEERKAEKGISDSNILETITDVKSPLLVDVIERDYAKDNSRFIGDIPDSVPVPRNERPVIDLRSADEAPTSAEQFKQSSQQPQQPRQPINPSFGEMPKKAQKESSRKLAKTIVSAYANINNVVREHIVKTDVAKLQMKAIKGEFDMDALNVELPISETETVTVGSIISDTNSSADDIFTCSDEFNEETEDLLTEVLNEKGVGMTPMQRLVWLYVEDIGKKGISAWGIWKTNKEILNTAMQILSQVKNPARPVATEYVPYNPPAPPKEDEPKADVDTQKPIETPEVDN